MNTAIITADESDTILAQYTSWTALLDPKKEFFIARASIYAQTKWSCVDIVFEGDDENIPDEIKEAVAYYAYADYSGNLFGDVAISTIKAGKLKSKREKLGELEEEISYFLSGNQLTSSAKSLGYPDTLMKVYCTKESINSELIRV